MIRGNTDWRALTTADVDWRGKSGAHSKRFDDFYYSSQNGREESEYVFLQGNRLAQRWSSHPHPSFCIVETGFGTGLNFLLTWKLWKAQPKPRPRLHFISIEKHPLTKDDMHRALSAWPELNQLTSCLLTNYPQPVPGQHRVVLDDGAVILDLWLEDAEDALSELASYGQSSVDAWYLDGFSPNRNQSMWTSNIFHFMADTSRKDATFATFTAAGDVRRGLIDAGFDVSKLPGYAKKRESMRGVYKKATGVNRSPSPKRDTNTPWDIRSKRSAAPQSVIVIGAGIAGCTSAAALARRNMNVCILECGRVANAGSGNDQGVLYTRLSQKHSPLNDFSLQSYSFAHRFYLQLLASGGLQGGVDGALCGSFHQSCKTEEMEAISPLLQTVPDLAQVLSSPQANKILGIEQAEGGYWFPGSGWMRPASVCQALLDNTNIKLLENTGRVSLIQRNGGWVAMSEDRILAEAECVVIAAGTATGSLADLHWLPLQAIRGQTSTLPATDNTHSLRTALCHSGYISPARLGNHCIGATFDIGDTANEVRDTDHRKNLDALGRAIPDWQTELAGVDEKTITGRVGYRCASPDYLPLIGPVPNRTLFLENYAALRKNARQTIACTGEFVPGLFLSTGHGSRGLTSAPLAAEILASVISAEPVPLSRELYRAISPARFIIRDLRRNRV